jgi:hypothetical protein
MSEHTEILNYINKAKPDTARLKVLFAEYLEDSTIDFEVRWETFCKAPASLKETNSYVPYELTNALPDDYIMYDGWVHMDRYQTKDTDDLIERIEENNDSEQEYRGKPIPKVDVQLIKKIIMENRLGSFTYDW